MVDFDFSAGSSLTMVRCCNDAALDHLSSNVGDDALWMGDSLAVEPRYAPDLAASLCLEGFMVELPDGRVVTASDLRH